MRKTNSSSMPMIGPGSIGNSRTLMTVPSNWHSTSQERPRSSMFEVSRKNARWPRSPPEEKAVENAGGFQRFTRGDSGHLLGHVGHYRRDGPSLASVLLCQAGLCRVIHYA